MFSTNVKTQPKCNYLTDNLDIYNCYEVQLCKGIYSQYGRETTAEKNNQIMPQRQNSTSYITYSSNYNLLLIQRDTRIMS